MTTPVPSAPRLGRWLMPVATLALFVAGGVGLWGELTSWPGGRGASGSSATSAVSQFPEVLTTDAWRALAAAGVVSASHEVIGRPNPFLPTGTDLDTPAGRDALRVRHMIELSGVLRRYRAAEGRFPLGQLLVVGTDGTACLAEGGWTARPACDRTARVRYLDPVPHDPGGGGYLYTSDGRSYTLSVRLETAGGKLASWEYVDRSLGSP